MKNLGFLSAIFPASRVLVEVKRHRGLGEVVMASYEPREHCKLELKLSFYGGLHSSYEVELGLSQHLVLLGQIDHGSGAFSDKQVRLEVFTPPDGEYLGGLKAKFMGDEDNPCGVVSVVAEVEPERSEYGEIDPVNAILHLSADAFEAIRRHAAEINDQGRIVRATIVLIGNALPAADNEAAKFCGLHPRDLDISANQVYGIKRFELWDARY